MCHITSLIDQPSAPKPAVVSCSALRPCRSALSSTHPASSRRIRSSRRIVDDSPRDELERAVSDDDLVAGLGSGRGELPFDALLDQPLLQLRDVPGVLEIRLGDPAFDRPSDDTEALAL